MSNKTMSLFSYTENNVQTNIICVLNDNGSFSYKGRIKHINKSNVKQQKPNNEKRRERYKINRVRTERLNVELEKEMERERQRIKKLEIERKYLEDIKRRKDLDNESEIDMDAQLEDMESYY